MQELLGFIFIVIIIWFVWFLGGGPERYEAETNHQPFLSDPTRPLLRNNN